MLGQKVQWGEETVIANKNKKNKNLVDLKLTITRGKMITLFSALEREVKSGNAIANDLLTMLERTGVNEVM